MIGNDSTQPAPSGSTNAYQISRSGGVNLWWFWFGLPTLTNLRIWVRTGRGRPLPTLTTANKGLTIELSIMHQVAGWATVIRVDNVENRENHQKWWHGGGRYRKENFEIIRPVGL